ncbi:MAG: hypothetical protein HY855_16150 [Burkholderiales bacterium]|nr:hypothetical protein [Burkholderiales bacterium]
MNWRRVGYGLLVALLGLAWWAMWATVRRAVDRDDAPAAVARAKASGLANRAAGWQVLANQRRAVVVPAASGPVTHATRGAAGTNDAVAWPVPGPGELAVCGHGIVKSVEVAPESPGEPSRQDLPEDLKQRLADDMDAQLAGLRPAPGVRRGPAAFALLQERLDDLVTLAVNERDPLALQWASKVCAKSHDTACARLPPRLWVSLEPDNAVAWIWLARQDISALAEALHRIQLASRYDDGSGRLLQAVDAGLPADTPLSLRAWALFKALSQEATALSSMHEAASVADWCAKARVADANRRQPCGALAELMVGQGRDLLTRSIGVSLGNWAGWPAERVNRLRAEVTAVRDAAPRRFAALDVDGPYGCRTAAAMVTYARAIGELGEWQVWSRPEPAGR